MKLLQPHLSKYIYIGILAVSLISNIVLYRKLHALQNPGEVVAIETKQIVADISKFIVLPAHETPTLATVSDPAKLRDQKFFANAETGDKVLLYQASQKAILWRPSTKKVIEISSLSTSRPVDNNPSTTR